jgi:hypothetical protein
MKTKFDITIADISGARLTIPAGTRTAPAHNLPAGSGGKPNRWVIFGRWATAAEKRQWKFGVMLDWREVSFGPRRDHGGGWVTFGPPSPATARR